MKCPKCEHINPWGTKQCEDCGVVFADIRAGRGAKKEVNLTCAWNDHGYVCGKLAAMSDDTRGGGPWYCSKHYWARSGIDVKETPARPMGNLGNPIWDALHGHGPVEPEPSEDPFEGDA